MTTLPIRLPLPPALARARALGPGLLLCVVIALAATFLAEHYGGPAFLFALLLGIAFHFLEASEPCRPGIDFAAKRLVRLGVALLGARIAAGDLAGLGAAGVAALVAAVGLTIGFGLLLARVLKLPPMLGLLSGGATGICGISAAMAISSTLPAGRDNERYTLLTAIGVAALSTLAMVLYPLVVAAAGLSPAEAGLFLGGSIHDVAQVVGAGYTISPATGDAATLAKLIRVAMLMPVVILFACVFHAARRRAGPAGAGGDRGPLVPWFLLGFIALAAANSLGALPAPAVSAASDVSRACLVVAISALGVKTALGRLAELGWRPIALMAGEATFVAGWMLAAVFLLRAFA